VNGCVLTGPSLFIVYPLAAELLQYETAQPPIFTIKF